MGRLIILKTSDGYVVAGEDGQPVSEPFKNPQAAILHRLVLAAMPPAAPRKPTPVAIPNGHGTYSITAGDGTGRVIDGPYASRDEANRKAGGLDLIALMSGAPAPLRAVADVAAGHRATVNQINITPGDRSPDVEDGRSDPPPRDTGTEKLMTRRT